MTPGSLVYASSRQSIAILIGSETEMQQLRYDTNGDGKVNAADVVNLVNFILSYP